jgi:hypothetical protein
MMRVFLIHREIQDEGLYVYHVHNIVEKHPCGTVGGGANKTKKELAKKQLLSLELKICSSIRSDKNFDSLLGEKKRRVWHCFKKSKYNFF